MSQSFEKKVGSRLQHYEPAPPPHLKNKVIDAVNPNHGMNGWQMTGMMFIVLSLLFWSNGASPGSSLSTSSSEEIELESSLDLVQDEPSKIKEILVESADILEKERKKPEMDPTLQVIEKKPQKEKVHVTRLQDGAFGDFNNLANRQFIETWHIAGKDLGSVVPSIGLIVIDEKKDESMMLSKTIRPVKKSSHFYFESGLFFLYQQAFPNLEDELVVTNFEGVSGFSPKRLGGFIEAGVHFRPIRKLRVHLGAKINTYQQSFRFGIRGFGADSVSVRQTGEQLIFEPIFEEDKVQIDHRLYSAGAKATFNWSIFPSYTNELVTGIEYLSVINAQQSFAYKNRLYNVGYSDQWLVSIGIRKTLLHSEKGMIQVHPSIRYSMNQSLPEKREVISMKPYSVGVSISYLFGNFREYFKSY